MELTYIPYEHPPAPVMTPAEVRAWSEPEPRQMTMQERADFHGISLESYENLIAREESHWSERD